MQPDAAPAWMVRGLDRLPVLPGETLAGRYRIERVLGAGGMGVVLRARDQRVQRRVAIKFPNPSSHRSDDVERLCLEAEILASLASPHIARSYELDSIDGLPFLVMEYLEGPTLAELVEREPFCVERAIAILLDVCLALEQVHAHGVVHRDVKLENLMLVEQEGTLRAKLIDFGIAKRLDAPPSEACDAWVGSPRYMAPEQLDGDAGLDRRADIWSVGIVAFELLSGEHPFVADSVDELRSAILHDDAPNLHQLRSDVPAALAAIVARCLAKRPQDRFTSIAELGDALGCVQRQLFAS